MRAAVVFVALVAISGVALGEVTASAPAPTPAADVKEGASAKKVGAPKNGKKARRLNGATKPDKTAKQSRPLDTLTTCLELWEPATHMTRREWARACRRVDERLKSATLR